MAIIAQLEREGKPFPFLLDILAVPESHTGETLAREFSDVLEAFEAEDKVSLPCSDACSPLTVTVT